MELPTTAIIDFTTTETPNSTQEAGGNDFSPHGGGEVDWVVWVIVSGSLLCLVSAVLGYVFMVWLPRRGYLELEGRRQQMRAITQLLEEVRGRPRKVDVCASLTESERHFLIHDFADFP